MNISMLRSGSVLLTLAVLFSLVGCDVPSQDMRERRKIPVADIPLVTQVPFYVANLDVGPWPWHQDACVVGGLLSWYSRFGTCRAPGVDRQRCLPPSS
jgi:hypothetical protein